MCCFTEYNSIYLYIDSQTDLYNKIVAINAIIAANENAMLAAATGGAGVYQMYEMDDGQIRIKTGYRSLKELIESSNALEVIKQRYVNQLNGPTVQLRGRATFRGRRWGGCW